MKRIYNPGKINGFWTPTMEVDGKMFFRFNWVIFRFHVNFSGVYLRNSIEHFGNEL